MARTQQLEALCRKVGVARLALMAFDYMKGLTGGGNVRSQRLRNRSTTMEADPSMRGLLANNAAARRPAALAALFGEQGRFFASAWFPVTAARSVGRVLVSGKFRNTSARLHGRKGDRFIHRPDRRFIATLVVGRIAAG